VSTTTETAPAGQPPAGRLTPELIRQIAALSRDSKENLVVLLQEELDGGPFIGDLPEQPPDEPGRAKAEWADEIARRVEDMRAGRVEVIDAQGSAARLLQRVLRKYGP
jgi:hypothetical protein